jgi:hypothetical protein
MLLGYEVKSILIILPPTAKATAPSNLQKADIHKV